MRELRGKAPLTEPRSTRCPLVSWAQLPGEAGSGGAPRARNADPPKTPGGAGDVEVEGPRGKTAAPPKMLRGAV